MQRLESSFVCPGAWALRKCSANATLIDGFSSTLNGCPQTEQCCSLPSATKRGSAPFWPMREKVKPPH